MDGTGGRELAAIKVKRFDAKHSGVEFGIRLQEFSKRAARDIATTREGDMRVPGTQIGFEPDSQRRILHAFVKLEEMRMTFPNADPNDFRRTFRRKRPDAFDGKKKCAKLDRAQFFAQRKIDTFRDVGKETEGQMHLIAFRPAHTTNVRVKIDK